MENQDEKEYPEALLTYPNLRNFSQERSPRPLPIGYIFSYITWLKAKNG